MNITTCLSSSSFSYSFSPFTFSKATVRVVHMATLTMGQTNPLPVRRPKIVWLQFHARPITLGYRAHFPPLSSFTVYKLGAVSHKKLNHLHAQLHNLFPISLPLSLPIFNFSNSRGPYGNRYNFGILCKYEMFSPHWFFVYYSYW